MKRLSPATLGIVIMIGLAAFPVRAAGPCSEPVPTAQGPVIGAQVEGAAVCAYKGVPYAAPPVGEQRWRPAQDPPARSGPLNARSFSNQCLQPGRTVAARSSKEPIPSGEDCLYLNIWRPMKSGNFPVMVWVHGGGFTGGSGATPVYWGDALVNRRDVVLVTINYRLGPLGFLSLKELAAEDPNRSAGNYGILDQIQALRWVKDNIANFGGDPGRVTVFGESAGGFSVCTLLASPLAEGLFARAIMESGACFGAKPEADGENDGAEFAAQMGCAGPAVLPCLRAKTGPELIAAMTAMNKGLTAGLDRPDEMLKFIFLPHTDGYVLKESPRAALAAGRFPRVPLLAGTNRDEIKLFLALSPRFRSKTPRQLDRYVANLIGPDAVAEFHQTYPYRSYRRPADAVLDAMGDMFLGCSTFDAIGAVAAAGPNVYYYRFDYDHHRAPHFLGAFHALEIAWVFGRLDQKPFPALIPKRNFPAAQDLSATMMDYWTNFAATGDPNGPGLPVWPAYNAATKMRMYLDVDPHAGPTENQSQCAFWDRHFDPIFEKYIK